LSNDKPYEGIISMIFGSHSGICFGKHLRSTSSMTDTAVDAPGEAPNNAAIDPSAALITSVPNCR